MPTSLDTALLRAFRTRLHHPAIERGVLAFTTLGEHGALWFGLSAGGALLDPERRPLYARAGMTVGAAYAINQAIKFAVRRPRPRLADLPPLKHTQTQLSYPSAHATTSFAGARALAAVWPAAPLYVVALAMALSRPYVGVHYPSDSLAGAVLGSAVAEVAA